MEYIVQEPPKIVIIEQPQQRSLRFRYHCENRGSSFSPILGMHAAKPHRSYPTVAITGFQGRAKLVVHCVTSGDPPIHHPNKLVGKNCKDGVYVAYIGPETDMRFSLNKIGIQCVRKQDVGEELKTRISKYSNPFVASSDDPSSINVNSVCLCFQAFLETEPNKFDRVLTPVVSEVIFDKKSHPELKICNISASEAPASGGKKIILLCEKVDKMDIEVRFFEDMAPHSTWEAFGSFSPQDVYKQVAIVFVTPAYYDLTITAPVQVSLQLRSSSLYSDSINFTFHPVKNARSEVGQKGLPPFQYFRTSNSSNESLQWQSNEIKNLVDEDPSTVNSSDRYKFTIPMQNFHIQWGANSSENSSDDNVDYNGFDLPEDYNIESFLEIANSILECGSAPF